MSRNKIGPGQNKSFRIHDGASGSRSHIQSGKSVSAARAGITGPLIMTDRPIASQNSRAKNRPPPWRKCAKLTSIRAAVPSSMASVLAICASKTTRPDTAKNAAPINAPRRPTMAIPAQYVASTAMSAPKTDGIRCAQIFRSPRLENSFIMAVCAQ